MVAIAILILCAIIIFTIIEWKCKLTRELPISVNYHFTRTCNFECGFCFHTAKTSYMLPLQDAKRGIKMLKDCGTKKINFAGGEPFQYKDYLGELLRYSRHIGMQSISIVSNGSLINRGFIATYAPCIDVLAISCDSFSSDTNAKIGRKSGAPFKRLQMIASWCKEHNIKLKINTVVNRYNLDEDMNAQISQLNPFRWKCFQVLIDESENGGAVGTIRDARPFTISLAEFNTFIERHPQQKCLVPEPNNLMRSSYLILDEYMRFLTKEGTYNVSPSILDVGVIEAMRQTVWNKDAFILRGGIYQWTKRPIQAVTW